MLTILTTTDLLSPVSLAIQSIDRLDELVSLITDQNEDQSNDITIEVSNKGIRVPMDWHDSEPPYVLPITDFSSDNLLAIVFFKLQNHQKAFEYVQEKSALYNDLLIATHLQFGYTIDEEQIQYLKNTSEHNLAIIYQFGNINQPVGRSVIQDTFETAMNNAPTDEKKLYSTKHYVNFLLDHNRASDAEKLLLSVINHTTNDNQKNALSHQLSTAKMAQTAMPYDTDSLKEILDLQKNCIEFYEKKDLKINAGLLLISASEIASLQKDFIQSKDLINKAIRYFTEEDIHEFMGEATVQKAILLYTWSKNGSPQYYKPAINTFQNALKVFKRDTHPLKFADIHHNLALIYSEIQVSEKEKPIWTAFCASSFKEALNYYSKEQHPYQYAMISHNYATALMGFPEAKLHNNHNKAFDLFEEALVTRTAEEYPFERALTLLNQLELYWLIHNEDSNEENKHFDDMVAKAQEIHQLVNDADLIAKAKEHLDALEKLKSFIQ